MSQKKEVLWRDTVKPIVLVCVTHPGDLRKLFHELSAAGERGFDLRCFDVNAQEELLTVAQDLARREKPVAILLSERMKPQRNEVYDHLYKGKWDGHELAVEVAKKIGGSGQSLSVIFSAGASNCKDIDGDSPHNVACVQMWPQDRRDGLVLAAVQMFFAPP
jgi:hypothetical protein